MFIWDILNLKVKRKIKLDDDSIGHLHNYVTALMLVGFSAFLGLSQFAGDPIHCWTPAEYKEEKNFQKYVDAYCFIHPMYYIPMDSAIPFDLAEREEVGRDVGYYRWVFVILLFQALLFTLPRLVWKTLSPYSGMNVTRITAMISDIQFADPDERDTKLGYVTNYVDRWLRMYKRYSPGRFARYLNTFSSIIFCFGKRRGVFLTGLYLFTKVLYLFNVCFQFYILSLFLGLDYSSYGFKAFQGLVANREWEDLNNFPRIALCDFLIRQMNNVQRFTVQCVLSINLFVEKVFIFLWFWFLFLAIASAVNLLQWAYLELLPGKREALVKKYVKQMLGEVRSEDKPLLRRFTHEYLHHDGIFVLRIAAINTTDVLVMDLVKQLWEKFKILHKSKENDDSEKVY